MRQKYKFLEHTADIKFQAFGNSLEEVFENSALAMFSSMFSGKVEEKIEEKIEVKGNDNENILYNFLEELLFLFDRKGFFLSKIKNLKIKGNKLTAELLGDKAKNYEISIDAKAVTYNEMFIKKIKDTFVAQVVIDV
jgi:SHS2 domain-containing protein